MYDIIIGRNPEDIKKLGTSGTIFLGKHYVKMGQTTSLSNRIYMDVAKSHVVFVVGKRGSGKCLVGDTLIPLNDGSVRPIKDIAGSKEKVFGLDKQLKIDAMKSEGFYERTVKRVLNVELRSGKEIKLTPEHPLLTLRGWVKAENLTINDRIATPRKVPNFGKECMEPEKIKLLAYIIAEGHATETIVRFTNFDEAIIREFKECVEKYEDNVKAVCYRRGQFGIVNKKIVRDVSGLKRDDRGQFTGESRIIPQKSGFVKWLSALGLGNKKAGEKFIPENVLRLKKEHIALFLNRLFSCDGSIYRKQSKGRGFWQVSYASKSMHLIRQVQHLLLRFGLISSIRGRRMKCSGKSYLNYELIIRDADGFIKEIGFFGAKKGRQEEALREITVKVKNPNVDTIPKEIWDIYRPKSWAMVGRAMGYKTPKAMRSSIEYSPSRQKLLQIALADECEDIRRIAESDIFWDSISSIQQEEGVFRVYDITVPEFHNFIANDIIVHNSYTMGVIAESIMDLPEEVKNNLSVIILDTMGIYWTMKYPNKQERELVDEWDIEPKPLDVNIFTPLGYYKKYKEDNIPTDFPFAIKTSELSAYEWSEVFSIELHSPVGSLIERVIENFKEENIDYDMDEIIDSIRKDERSGKEAKDAAENRFISAKHWGLFSRQGTMLHDLIIPGQVTVLDVSCYAYIPGAESLRALVIGLVAQKLFTQRMMVRKNEEYESIYRETHLIEKDDDGIKKEPMVWLITDEAHEFLPNEGKTVATQPLITILREGRQPGISLVLASQQPGKIHTDVITQSDIVIAHRVTANVDIVALGNLMQSYMREGLDKQINYLPRATGAALIFDDENEKLYPMRVRPRYTWHGGSSPSILARKKKIFEI